MAIEKLINTTGYNAVVKARYGYVLFNKNDHYIGRAIEKYGEFSESEVAIFRQLCLAGDVVVEVGANIGTHTMILSQFVGQTGRVYAFEPQRIVFQTLCANMALNNIENVECFQVAAADESGFILFPEIRYDIEGNYGAVEMDKFTAGNKIPQVTLDELLDVPRMKLLKIDVEGMEHKVISGAKNLIAKHKPIMYVENDRQDKSQALIELIQSLDYRLYWHCPPLYNPANFAGDAENLYPGVVSVNMVCVPRSNPIDMMGFQEVQRSDEHILRPQ